MEEKLIITTTYDEFRAIVKQAVMDVLEAYIPSQLAPKSQKLKIKSIQEVQLRFDSLYNIERRRLDDTFEILTREFGTTKERIEEIILPIISRE